MQSTLLLIACAVAAPSVLALDEASATLLQRLDQLEQRLSLRAFSTEVRQLEEHNRQLETHNLQLEERVATLERLLSAGNVQQNVRSNVDTDGSAGRRLSAGSTQTIIDGIEHEFPSGHSCSNIAGYMKVLPQTTTGVSYHQSPSTDLTGNVSLVSVHHDWTTTTIDTMPAPLKLVHDCGGAAPVLHLSLSTKVSSLVVNGFDVGAYLSATSPSTALVGKSFIFQSGAFFNVLCVHPKDATIGDGVKVWWSNNCHLDQDRLHFKAVDAGDGKFVLQNGQERGWCLHPEDHAEDGNNMEGTPIHFWVGCSTSMAQIQYRALDAGNGMFVLQSAYNPMYCLKTESSSGTPEHEKRLVFSAECSLSLARLWFRALSVPSWQ